MKKKGGVLTKTARITLSFDDGRKDNFEFAAPLLKKYDIPATFNIAAAYIEQGVLEENGLPEPAMTMADVRALSMHPGFEIASHGYRHRNDWADVLEGKRRLLKGLGRQESEPIGFASPRSEMTQAYIRENLTEFQRAGFHYVRTDYRIQSLRLLRVLARKAARVIHSRLLFTFAYAQTLQDGIEDMTVFSVPILRDTKPSQIMRLIELAVRKKKSCTLLFHGILPDGKTCCNMTWAWRAEDFEALLQYLCAQRDAGKLELMTVGELCRRSAMEKNI